MSNYYGYSNHGGNWNDGGLSTEINWDSCVRYIIVLVLIAIVVFSLFSPSITCDAKTRDIGFPHRWTLLGGCQIQVNENQWIPLESYYFKQE